MKKASFHVCVQSCAEGKKLGDKKLLQGQNRVVKQKENCIEKLF
jgi:hypothetical protein